MKLLILEDETLLIEKYKKYLAEDFDEITMCHSLEEAKECINHSSFNILLIDYNLPDGNGLELLESYPDPSDSPLSIMITAYSKEKIAIQSLNMGVFKYIEKPVDKEKLITTVHLAIEEAKRREEADELLNRFSVSSKAEKILVDEYLITARELEVLKNTLIHGKNNNVALILNIGQGTVRNHLSNIFQKLHINNKDDLRATVQKLNS